ncbi:MAG: hypothetical protein ABGZ35_16495 [Planctomycetaceae bacterium]
MQSNEPLELIALDKAATMLASAESFDDIKSIRNVAKAAQVYVKAARCGLEAQNRAACIRIQAERKAGKWLADLNLRGGDRKSKSKGHPAPLKLEDLRITRDESKRWQRQASVSEAVFQRYVSTSNQTGREVSSAGLIRFASNGSQSGGNGHAHKLAPERLAFPSPPEDVSNGSNAAKELIHEIADHRRLLVSLLTPICTNEDAQLNSAERRHVKYLLSQIATALKKLNKLV